MLQKPLFEMTLEEISALLDVESERANVYNFLVMSAQMGQPDYKVKDGTLTLDGEKILLKAKADNFDATQLVIYPSPLFLKKQPMNCHLSDGETRLVIALFAIAEKDGKQAPALHISRSIKGQTRDFLISVSLRSSYPSSGVVVNEKLRQAVKDVLDGTNKSALQSLINNESPFIFRASNMKEEEIKK